MTKTQLNAVRAHTVGFEALGIAFYKNADAIELDFDAVEELARAQTMSITPTIIEDPVESNDAVEDEGFEIAGYTISLKSSAIKLETRAKMFGHRLDGNGGMIIRTGDKPKPFALLAKFPKSNGGAEYVALYKGVAKEPTEEHETKKRSGVTRSFPTTEINFSKAANGLLQYKLDSDAENFKSAIAEKWFDEVYIPEDEPATAQANPENAEG